MRDGAIEDISCDGDGVPVSVEFRVDDERTAPWPADVNDGETRAYTVSRDAGEEIGVVASADLGGFIRSVDSTDSAGSAQVVLLPDVDGYKDQGSAEAFLRPYVDDETDTLSLAPNQAIYLLELGSTDPESGAFDLQDAVVLVTLSENRAETG
ncbi:hypothetical protein SAMN04488124_2917 [Halogeometricum limi]|uniref:Uncharacterized protein n=1 Tax=Halogeometricum limi TaxID=555875 RepID=A0A1I6IA32_9EURY|nr:hypothetical protein [Halogeometricum limi]SFR63541.1 hypothetical protein SAMN04488124_2917 [Halogeometricum limi]